ncbi:MAG: 5-(carboxyamino)imidazole ribonucleotide mutase [Bdellovibrionales bacterium]|nr:5-(carboxyamino)imidazole ribonucleotide mutase [Bdellovibrionales bacterium]
MGSDSDLKVMREAAQILDSAQVPYEIKIVSAHRTPQEMQKFALQAPTRGIRIIIAGAGGAAHLPGMVASLTSLPVIGVPIQVGNLEGLDALLSIAQMPRGVPVATMAVDNATNAGLMAIRILALQTPSLQHWLKKYRDGQKLKVRRANEALDPS